MRPAAGELAMKTRARLNSSVEFLGAGVEALQPIEDRARESQIAIRLNAA